MTRPTEDTPTPQGGYAKRTGASKFNPAKSLTKDMVSEFFNASYGQPRFGHFPLDKYMVGMEFEVGGAYEDWGWAMYEKQPDGKYKTFCTARNLKDLIAKADTKVTDLITTDSSQDTVTPSRPGEHKKQELERGK